MLIDWFTLIAQLVNFLILAWLLKRFLYHPIVAALDAREKKIASELQHATMVEDEAKKSMSELKQKHDALDKQRTQIMQQAAKEADEKKAKLFIEAHQEYETLRARLKESLHNEQKNLQQEIIDRITSEVFSIAEKVLAELADLSLEDRIVKVFCERLQNTAKSDITAMTGLFHQSNHPPIIRSAYTLTSENCERVKKNVMELFGIDSDIVVEIDTNLISGIELSMNGYSIKWNIKAYLEELNVTNEAASRQGEERGGA